MVPKYTSRSVVLISVPTGRLEGCWVSSIFSGLLRICFAIYFTFSRSVRLAFAFALRTLIDSNLPGSAQFATTTQTLWRGRAWPFQDNSPPNDDSQQLGSGASR